ncbi:MAG: hypothetical protein WCQ50_03785 [Spirochaetota bacterium]
MKRTVLLVAAMLVLVPGLLFAQFKLGAMALYNFPLSPAEVTYIDSQGVGLQDFSFGAEARLGLGLLDAGVVGLVDPGYVYKDANGEEYTVTYFDIMPRVGLALNLGGLRVSAGVGPSFTLEIYDNGDFTDPFGIGSNAMASIELPLTKTLSLAVNYLMKFEFNIKDMSTSILNADMSMGQIGFAILF